MTTRLEVEYAGTKSKETLLQLEDRMGIHKTEFGDVKIDIERTPVNHNESVEGHRRRSEYYSREYYKEPPYNTDIIIDASQAPDLAQILRAPKRRISVGTNGYGAQQIGREVTLFIHSDSFRRKKKCYIRIAGFNVPNTERVEKR